MRIVSTFASPNVTNQVARYRSFALPCASAPFSAVILGRVMVFSIRTVIVDGHIVQETMRERATVL